MNFVLTHLRFAAFLLAGLTASPALAATCQITPFELSFTNDSATTMVVTSGSVCGVNFISGGRGRTVSAGGINHLAVAEQGTHGRAGTQGFNVWGYQSQKGYVGKDRFVLEVGGEIMYNRVIRGTSHVTVDVDVVR
ncbi:MAG: hypothetical protein ACRYGP_26370 [Janthinobacterium lividum]